MEHCAGAPLLVKLAGAVLETVKEHMVYFPATDVHVLFSATQLLALAKACFNVEMRQELLECAKVSASVQAMQAYHSEGRAMTLITPGRTVF